MAYKIDPHFCVGCEACYRVCKLGAVEIVVQEHNCRINPEKCVECGVCVNECPVLIITPDEEHARTSPKPERVWIEESECIGCSKCQRNCPADAIEGVVKQPFRIDERKCVKCGYCVDHCPKNAIHGSWAD